MPFVTFTVRRSLGAAEKSSLSAAIRLFGERLNLAPQDVLFIFSQVEPNLPRFPAASIGRGASAGA